jgi:drug/metabolite transporter (DMT)-like permease
VLWGASFVATRQALEGWTPQGLVALRFLLGAVVVGLAQRLRGGPLLPKSEDVPRCALLGAILAAHILLQAFALRDTTAIHSGWLVAFGAVAVTLGAALFLGERIPRRNAWGVVLAVLGVALVTAEHTPDFERARTGDLLVLASCGTWAAYTLLSKRCLESSGAWRVTPLVLAIAGTAAALTAFPGGFVGPRPGGVATGALLFLGLGACGLAFTAWSATVERFGALRAGLLQYLQPFVTLVLALAILGEPVGAWTLVGGPLVLLGVAFAGRR